MAKRFTDTEKWKKKWLRQLSSEYKLFWVYLLDDCTHAGIWDVDMEIANIRLGLELEEEKVLDVFKDKILSIDNGNKWFVPGFIDFQYGDLNSGNRVHNSVISSLKKEGAYKGLKHPLQGCKDKDKDKAKDKDKDKAKNKDKQKTFDFESVWALYPPGKKFGKAEARGHFNTTVKTDEDFANLKKALKNYIDSKRVKEGFAKDGCNWFDDWQPWVDWKDTEPKKPVLRDPGAESDAQYEQWKKEGRGREKGVRNPKGIERVKKLTETISTKGE